MKNQPQKFQLKGYYFDNGAFCLLIYRKNSSKKCDYGRLSTFERGLEDRISRGINFGYGPYFWVRRPKVSRYVAKVLVFTDDTELSIIQLN